MVKTVRPAAARDARPADAPTEGELAAQTARELPAMASGKTGRCGAAGLRWQELYASEPIEARLGDLTGAVSRGLPAGELTWAVGISAA